MCCMKNVPEGRYLWNSNKLFWRLKFALFSMDTFRAELLFVTLLFLVSSLFFLQTSTLSFISISLYLIYFFIHLVFLKDRGRYRFKEGEGEGEEKERWEEYSWGVTFHSRDFFNTVLINFPSLSLLLIAVLFGQIFLPICREGENCGISCYISWNFTKY